MEVIGTLSLSDHDKITRLHKKLSNVQLGSRDWMTEIIWNWFGFAAPHDWEWKDNVNACFHTCGKVMKSQHIAIEIYPTCSLMDDQACKQRNGKKHKNITWFRKDICRLK